LDGVRASSLIESAEKSNNSVRAAADNNAVSLIILDRVIDDYREAGLIYLDAKTCRALYSVTVDYCLTAAINDYPISSAIKGEALYRDAPSLTSTVGIAGSWPLIVAFP